MQEKILQEKRDEILKLAFEYSLRNIKVFGSFARNEVTSESDIDFLVTPSDTTSLFDLVELKDKLEELLNRKVDLVTENAIHWSLREKIKKEAVEI